MILKVDEFLKEINDDLKTKVRKLDRKPRLTTIRVGEDAGAASYEKSIIRQAESVGIEIDSNFFDSSIEEESLIEFINKKNKDKDTSGILVFSPIRNMNLEKIFNSIDPKKDVDGQNQESITNVYIDKDYVNTATTAVATLEYLKSITNLESKDVLIINRSMIIGRPLSQMLLNENATVTVAHSKTKDLLDKMQNYDIIITAVGKPEIFKGDSLQKGTIIIDLAYSVDAEGKVKGDFKNKFENSNIDYLPPLGGIGRINSNIILRNTYLNEVRNGK